MNGVERVFVGYIGGKHLNPNYQKLGDHTEALFIEYNPQQVSYWRLLEMWHDNDYPWKKPSRNTSHKQYRSAVFWTTLQQQDEALQFFEHLQTKNPQRSLYVDLERAGTFYRAEAYHQNYLAQREMGYVKTTTKKSGGSTSTGTPCLSKVCQVPWKRKKRDSKGLMDTTPATVLPVTTPE